MQMTVVKLLCIADILYNRPTNVYSVMENIFQNLRWNKTQRPMLSESRKIILARRMSVIHDIQRFCREKTNQNLSVVFI